MARFILSFLLILTLPVARMDALSVAERAIVEHIGEVNKRQATELLDQRAKVVWLDKELRDTEPKIQKLGQDLNRYMGLYAKEHEARLKQDATILRLWIAVSLMTLAFLAMVVWKFKLYRFIPGMTFAP